MAYCTEQDIEKRLPASRLAEITDDEPGSNDPVIDSGNVSRAIADADSEIDTYLRGKHDVPLATVPDTVRRWSVILSIWNLYARRIDLSVPETLEKDYDRVVGQLKNVRDNKLMIDDATSDANTAGYYKTNKTSSSRIFTSNSNETGRLDRYFSPSRMTPQGL
jgi:phage gp36-like protein